jgi:hypothetical protein
MSQPTNVVLVQAAPQIHHEPPENHTTENVTLHDLQTMEKTLVQKPGARWSTTQRFFFEALLSHPTLDPNVAARQVGIKPAKARKWLLNPATQDALNHLATVRARRIGIDSDGLLRKMVDLLEKATGEKPVHKTFMDKGAVWSEQVHHTDLGAAARFTDQLGKHLKIFQPESDGGAGVTLNLNMGGPTAGVTLEHDPAPLIDPSSAPASSFTLNMTGAEDAEVVEAPAEAEEDFPLPTITADEL